jgi:K+-sensing histidine kinase KdpD
MAKPMRLVPAGDHSDSEQRPSDVWALDESGEVAPNPAAFALHDAKNLIAVLKASLHYLSAELADKPKSGDIASALEDARDRADRMSELLCEAIVAMQGHRPHRTAPAALRVAPVITALANRVGPMAAMRGVRLVAGGTEDALAQIDRGLFERAILNFVDNALRYSKPGDTIEIEYLVHGERVIVAVADEGPGIPEELRNEVFESDRNGASSGNSNFGLGLAFCREAARAHGGNAWAFNRANGGACFVFEVAASTDREK